MFGTKGVATEERSNNGGSKYLPYGVVKAKINSLVVQKAKNTESRRVVFYLESEPVKDPAFKGVDGAKGRIGRMASNYMATSKAYDDFMRQVGIIADKLGIRKEVDEVTGNSFEEYILKVNALFAGRYLWWNIGADEYAEKKTNLKLMKYDFVKSTAEVDETTLRYDGFVPVEIRNAAGVVVLKFDKTNKFHFTPYVKPDEDFSHPGATMFQVPKGPDVLDALPPKKEFSVDDLPFSPGSSDDDLPFGQD